jgi:hypothetical protein
MLPKGSTLWGYTSQSLFLNLTINSVDRATLGIRTSLIISLQRIISRNCGCGLSGAKMKQITVDHISPLLAENDDLAFNGKVSKKSIDFLSKLNW